MTNGISSLNEDQFALVLALDDNFFGKTKNRWYQLEALKCLEAWRNKAGWLSKIECYGLKSSPFTNLDKNLEKFGVRLLQFKDEDLSSRNKLFKKIIVQKILADNDLVEEQFLINIDLDMTLQKEIPRKFFDNILGHVLIPRYSLDEAIQIERTRENSFSNPTCSFFIVQDRKMKFFNDLYTVACSDEFKTEFNKMEISQQYEEEIAYDFLLAKNNQLENRVATRVDKSILDQIYFDHQHISNNEAIKFLKKGNQDEC